MENEILNQSNEATNPESFLYDLIMNGENDETSLEKFPINMLPIGNENNEQMVNENEEPIIKESTEPVKVVTIDDEHTGYEPITETFDQYIERHMNDEVEDVPLDENTAAAVIMNRYTDIKMEDAVKLAAILKEWKNGEIGSLDAFNKLPPFITIGFTASLAKAGIPAHMQTKQKRDYAKAILEDLSTSTQMKQLSNEVDTKISDIYAQYGNDVNILYQAGVYEKINTMKKVAEALKAEKIDLPDGQVPNEKDVKKYEEVVSIIDALYESFKFEKFAKRISHIKAKQIDLTDTRRCFNNFKSKYSGSTFSCADVSSIVPIVEKYCEFSHEKAIEFAVVFCEYCKNMRPSRVSDHVFMYYTISNINSLMITIGEKSALFANILISNIKKLMEIRENRSNGEDYVALELTEDEVNEIIAMSNKIMEEAKENKIEEEQKESEPEQIEENVQENEEPVSTTETNSSEEVTVEYKSNDEPAVFVSPDINV